MRTTRVWIAIGCCLFAATLLASAQSGRKPGLWEVTTTTNMAGMQMPPNAQTPPNMQLPPGVKLPPGMQRPSGGGGSPFGPTTTQICLTQAMIDEYGGPVSALHNTGCQYTNIAIKPTSMTLTITCTGAANVSGTVESTLTDANTVHTKVHMTGTMQMGPNSRPVDMTVESTSVYKGPDCGTVKPFEMPAK